MTMRPGDEFVIAPRGYHAFELECGSTLRIVDEEGQQCCDFVCFNATDPRERLSTHATIMRNGTISITAGHTLYSTRQRPLFTIIEDTLRAGDHDLLAGMCTQASNELKFGVTGTPNCTANLTAALASFGIPPTDIVDCLNVFMRMTIEVDGTVEIRQPRSKPGDYLALRAEIPSIVGISNCPQEWGPTNARHPTRIRLEIS